MVWYAVYRIVDGELYSIGTELASPLPADLNYKTLENEPDLSKIVWDKNTLSFVTRTITPDSDIEELKRLIALESWTSDDRDNFLKLTSKKTVIGLE